MVVVMALGLASEPARAEGGRIEGAKASVRPQPATRSTSTGSASRPSQARSQVRGQTSTTRVHHRPAPSSRGGPAGPMRVSYQVVRRRPAPAAVAPPKSMGPTTQPLRLDEDPPRPPFRRHAHRWPYEARKRGWVVDPWTSSDREHRRVAGRASAEASYLYRGLWRTGFAARVGTPRLDVDTQMSFYYEAPTREALYLGDTSLSFAPVALPQVVWRVGTGLRYMLDAKLPGSSGAREYAAGWNLNTSIDVFPGPPFVLSARLDRGMLYRTPVFRARATVGLIRERYELFVGYDHLQIERTALGGPLAGLRAWL